MKNQQALPCMLSNEYLSYLLNELSHDPRMVKHIRAEVFMEMVDRGLVDEISMDLTANGHQFIEYYSASA